MIAALALLICLASGQSPDTGGVRPTSPTLFAVDPGARLAQAQSSFDEAVALKNHSSPDAQRLYRQALVGFQSLIDQGQKSSGLYYNVANAHLRLGDVGRAILNYRRGLRLRPGDENIRKNLQVARNLCELQLPKPAASAAVETLLFWHYGTSAAVRTRVALLAYVAFWALLLVMLFLPRRVAALTWTARVLAALLLVLGASIGWDTIIARNRPEGVLVADKVVLRKGNGDYYDPQLDRPLTPGVEFRLLEDREDVKGADWYHVQLTDGKDGWLRADQAELI